MQAKPSAYVIFIPGFPNDEADTACLPAQQYFIRELQAQLQQKKVIVLSFQYPFEAKKYKWNGVSVIAFGGKNKGGLSRLLLWGRVKKQFKQIHKQYQVEGMLSFWLGDCAMVAQSLASRFGIPHFCWLMGQDARPGNKYVARMKPKAGELIAISDFLSDELNRNYGIRPGNVIPLGVDPSAFNEKQKERNIDVLGVGSLIPLKQFDIFINIIQRLVEEKIRVKAVICGKGPEEARLVDLIRDRNLGEHVQLMGELPHDEVIEMMKRSKVLLHPSSYEGFGVVCLEARAAGCFVVSFTKPMKEEVGHWMSVETPGAMFEAVRRVLSLSVEPGSAIPFTIRDTVHSLKQLWHADFL